MLSSSEDSVYVVDTSIIIDGKATEMVEAGEIQEGSKIIVPIAALDELQAQASKNREEGFVGLGELTKLRTLSEEKKVKIEFTGKRPSMEDIRLARNGRIDAIIRDVARDNNGTLLTADYVQALVGSAQGIKVRHFPPAGIKTSGLEFEKYFASNTMSVHLKEGVVPHSKRGHPGEFVYAPVEGQEQPLTRQELESMVKEITEASRISANGSVEISSSGATVLQFGQYRIAITRPPFSEALEVTIVKPLVRLDLSDYGLSDKLIDRFRTKAEGILIAGPPGSGKSTLASSLADFYSEQGKVVKTFESPRDLQVSNQVSQYGPLEGSFERSAEILLLVRPDYTIFDEVRKTKDFEVFSDMRLAGVGMVGVVHASDAINAVQRFISRMDLGMVPHIVDTVIFVKSGKIEQVLELSLVVKVPSGMSEPDLSRPVIEVRDFESGRLEFEIYTFGEENVAVPIGDAESKKGNAFGVEKIAQERILSVMKKYDPAAEVRVISPNRAEVRVEESLIPRIIGRGGSNVKELENSLSIRLDIKSREDGGSRAQEKDEDDIRGDWTVPVEYSEKGNAITLTFPERYVGKKVNVRAGGERIIDDYVGREGTIALKKKSPTGKRLHKLHKMGVPVRAFLG